MEPIIKVVLFDPQPSLRLEALELLGQEAEHGPEARSALRQVGMLTLDEAVREEAQALLDSFERAFISSLLPALPRPGPRAVALAAGTAGTRRGTQMMDHWLKAKLVVRTGLRGSCWRLTIWKRKSAVRMS